MGAYQSYYPHRGREHIYKQKSVPFYKEEFSPLRLPLRSCRSLSDEPEKRPLNTNGPVVVPRDDIHTAYSYAYRRKLVQNARLGNYTQPVDAVNFVWGKKDDRSPTSEDEEYSEPYVFSSLVSDLKKSSLKTSHTSDEPPDSIYSLAEEPGETEYNHLGQVLKSSAKKSHENIEDHYDHMKQWTEGSDDVFNEYEIENTDTADVLDSKEKKRHLSNKSKAESNNLDEVDGFDLTADPESPVTENCEEFYDCAWQPSSGVEDMSVGKGSNVKVSRSTDCYEDAWDTVQKQRELQEKVLNAARKSSGVKPPSLSALRISPVPPPTPPTSYPPFSVANESARTAESQSVYEEPWDSKQRQKELEQRLTAPVQRKISPRETQPTLSPVFRQQNGQPFPSMGTSSAVPRSGSLSVSGKEESWDSRSRVNTAPFLRQSSYQDDMQACSSRRNVNKPCTVGENINPIIPLQNQSWYHGRISRSASEHLLRVYKEGSYLVRESESERGQFSLSIKSPFMSIHLRIASLPNGKFVLGENSPTFSTIPEMIDYYTRHPVPLKGAEHMTLLHPVTKH